MKLWFFVLRAALILLKFQWTVIDLSVKVIVFISLKTEKGSELQHVAINHSSANVGTETRQPVNDSWEHIAFHEPFFS